MSAAKQTLSLYSTDSDLTLSQHMGKYMKGWEWGPCGSSTVGANLIRNMSNPTNAHFVDKQADGAHDVQSDYVFAAR